MWLPPRSASASVCSVSSAHPTCTSFQDVIAGGGVGDGAIDGEINVAVIDNVTEAPISARPSTSANDVPAGNKNFCVGGVACDWTVSSRTGALTVVAVILDRDLHGTLEMSKDEAIQIPASIESLGAATPVNATSLLVPNRRSLPGPRPTDSPA